MKWTFDVLIISLSPFSEYMMLHVSNFWAIAHKCLNNQWIPKRKPGQIKTYKGKKSKKLGLKVQFRSSDCVKLMLTYDQTSNKYIENSFF